MKKTLDYLLLTCERILIVKNTIRATVHACSFNHTSHHPSPGICIHMGYLTFLRAKKCKYPTMGKCQVHGSQYDFSCTFTDLIPKICGFRLHNAPLEAV